MPGLLNTVSAQPFVLLLDHVDQLCPASRVQRHASEHGVLPPGFTQLRWIGALLLRVSLWRPLPTAAAAAADVFDADG